MAVLAVYLSSKMKSGTKLDQALKTRFGDVVRVGGDFWLVDTGRDVDQVAAAMKPTLDPSDTMFVARLTREAVPVLSDTADQWLKAPSRSWQDRGHGYGLAAGEEGPLARAA